MNDLLKDLEALAREWQECGGPISRERAGELLSVIVRHQPANHESATQAAGVPEETVRADENYAALERVKAKYSATVNALAAIINDAGSTYEAAKDGKPLVISIGQFRRLETAKALLPTPTSAEPVAQGDKP